MSKPVRISDEQYDLLQKLMTDEYKSIGEFLEKIIDAGIENLQPDHVAKEIIEDNSKNADKNFKVIKEKLDQLDEKIEQLAQQKISEASEKIQETEIKNDADEFVYDDLFFYEPCPNLFEFEDKTLGCRESIRNIYLCEWFEQARKIYNFSTGIQGLSADIIFADDHIKFRFEGIEYYEPIHKTSLLENKLYCETIINAYRKNELNVEEYFNGKN